MPTPQLMPDIILTLDYAGVIRQASVRNVQSLESHTPSEWIGTPWSETCESANAAKADRLVRDAVAHNICGYSQINQTFPDGQSALFEFVAVRNDARYLTVIGRNLQSVVKIQERLIASQRSIESEIWKLREMEARYTTLVNANSDAVVIARDPDLQVIDANTQARHNIGLSVGDNIAELVLSAHDSNKLSRLIDTARQSGRAPLSIVVAGIARESWRLRVSCYSCNASVQFMLQFSVHNMTQRLSNMDGFTGFSFSDIVSHLPDGMVAIDADDIITHVNPAFASMANRQNSSEMLGEPIHRWLRTSESSLGALRERLHSEDRVSNLPGHIHTCSDKSMPAQEVLLSAKRLASDNSELMLMVVRPVAA